MISSTLIIPLSVIIVFGVITRTESYSSDNQQCMGDDPMQSVATFMGMNLDYELADRICCNNHIYAEPSGYDNSVGFYSKLDPNIETIFYDSVCGIPLFVAPRGRSFKEFVDESTKHGWPSFRPEEIVSENVIIHDDGRMESRCYTHLGHNLPDGAFFNNDRYCIDLVCIAGDPSNSSSVGTDHIDDVLTSSEFDASNYSSSAENKSGKHSKTKGTLVIGAIVIAGIVVVAISGQMIRKRFVKSKDRKVSQDAKFLTSEVL